jgi:hypothetical protein
LLLVGGSEQLSGWILRNLIEGFRRTNNQYSPLEARTNADRKLENLMAPKKQTKKKSTLW